WIQRAGEMDVEDLSPEADEEFTHNGIINAVPYESHMIAALIYNADTFDDCGLAPPPAERPWQPDLQDALKPVRIDGDEVARWAIYTYHPLNFVHSWGGALVDDWRNPTDTLIDSPESVSGYEAYVDLIRMGYSPPSAS